jgi:hypothetical protein
MSKCACMQACNRHMHALHDWHACMVGMHACAPEEATADVGAACGAERGVISTEEARAPRGRECGGGSGAEHEQQRQHGAHSKGGLF